MDSAAEVLALTIDMRQPMYSNSTNDNMNGPLLAVVFVDQATLRRLAVRAHFDSIGHHVPQAAYRIVRHPNQSFASEGSGDR